MSNEESVSAFAAYMQNNKKKPAKKQKQKKNASPAASKQNGNVSISNKVPPKQPAQGPPATKAGKKKAKKQKQKKIPIVEKVKKSPAAETIIDATPPKAAEKRKNINGQDSERKPAAKKNKREKIVEPEMDRTDDEEESAEITINVSNSAEQEDPPTNDSIEDAREVFSWLISPIEFDDFFAKFWEKKPCLVQRNDSSYFSKLISCTAIDQMLLNNHVEFTKNIDITSYTNGVRKTLNPEGRAMPSTIWSHYEDGCSIRLLNPQTFMNSVFTMNATLQDYFHCMVGTNVYLTPPNSQGFAPHYDDIEAFVLQIEGQKRWKLYNPRSKDETLARFSSGNFAQDEIGEPILDKVLRPGDVLYFPRGTIHQASTQPGFHSLHVTLSMYQKHSYADLFEILLPRMISRAIQNEVDLRRGLPLDIWHNVGKVFMDDDEFTNGRDEILGKCEKLMQKVLRHADLDEAVDLMAKRFQHDALPPALTVAEKARTIFGAKTTVDKSGQVQYGYEITPDTHVRLIRANVLRVVEEEGAVRLYYCVDNSKEYHEYEPNFIEVEPESIEIVKQLIKEYPDYICTSVLEAESDDVKLSVVQGLYERGLLMVDEPMN